MINDMHSKILTLAQEYKVSTPVAEAIFKAGAASVQLPKCDLAGTTFGCAIAEAAPVPQGKSKQINAYKTLVKSLEDQLTHHREQATRYWEAIATLQSERDANAILSAEVPQGEQCPSELHNAALKKSSLISYAKTHLANRIRELTAERELKTKEPT